MKIFSALLSAYGKSKYSPKNQISNNVRNPRVIVPSVSATEYQWTDQQREFLDAVREKKSAFLTGYAGTGKTRVLLEAIEVLRRVYGRQRVAVTASTGVAACALQGQTLHSFAGVGLGEEDAEKLYYKIRKNRRALKDWKRIKALVIDEISMIEGEFFDKLEYVARRIMSDEFHVSRGELPWGGLQVLCCGDFLQLPPVRVDKEPGGKDFAFEAYCWDNSFQFSMVLDRVFRQSDPDHVRLLQSIRRGKLNPEDMKLLEQRFCDNDDELDVNVVRLFPRIKDVDRVNLMRLHGLEQEVIAYKAYDTGKEPWKRQLSNGVAPTELELCVGARVMLNKNLNVKLKLVNGATGTVIGFVKRRGRAKRICQLEGDAVLPVVKFDSGLKMEIKTEIWEVIHGDVVCAQRMQLPLQLAWAISIHKSQGTTLDNLYTDLSKSFGPGMAYVALSRVRSLGGLHLAGFKPKKVIAHPKVLAFYENLSN